MPTIDDKVVAMSFESSKFESGVNKSITAIDKLKAALKLDGASKGLDDVNRAAQNNQLGLIGRAVDAILPKLETLRLVAIGVLSQLATQAVRAGGQLVKSLTLDPIIAGFHEYTTNLNAVQTILANTAAAGTTLDDVNEALNTLNEYSDKTIYNFSQMAKNIGTFTAAGVDLDTATQAIKGIANLAALSGSNSEQASMAMYQLSQAISAGRVSLQDWNSVVNAGMGGTVFQRALAQTAVNMGTLKDSALKLVGPMKNVSIEGESFRQSISAGPGKQSWLTSKVLTRTLEQFTGDLSNAELAAQGFNDAQIAAIQKQAKIAQEAATQVKTLGGLLDTTRESIVSGWAQTWQIVFGDFEEAKELFTGISQAISGFVSASADARNKVLGDWKALGGRRALISALGTAFETLGAVIAPIKDAFRDIFPAKTGKDLFNLTFRFKEFVESLKPSEETIENLRRTFRGVFALFDIGKQIIGGIFGVFGRLFGIVAGGSGSFLGITASIGDFIVSIDEALKKGGGLEDFFDGVGDALEIPIQLLGALKDALGELFGGFSSGGFSSQMDGMTAAMTPFQKVLELVSEAYINLLDALDNSDKILEPFFESLSTIAQQIGPALASGFQNINFEAILSVVRTGLFAGLVLMFKQFLGRGSFATQLGNLGGGILGNISGSFDALRGSMVAMQQNIKAKTLKEIAIAVALLAASIVALSFVDPERLESSLTAITIAFGQLLGAMAILSHISKTAGFIKLPVIASSLILLAGAILVLTASVVVLSRLSWEELLKGLTGVGVLLGIISVAAIPLSANSSGMIRAGVGILAIAIALKILASAIADFGEMSWTELGKGLGAVAVGLGLLAGAATLMPSGMIVMGVGLIAIATALKILADVVEQFGEMDWQQMGKGLAGIGGALVVIAAAMRLMPKSIVITAAGLILVSLALGKIADAVEEMGGMSMEQIAKGLGALAGSLLILGLALQLMSGSVGGAVALAIAASGIALFVPALKALGKMSWQEIATGLGVLAASFIVLGAAGMLIQPAIPGLLGLGAALVLIGAGLALAGAGIALVGIGLSAIAVAAPTAVGILIEAILELLRALPEIGQQFILGMLEIVKGFAAVAPSFVDAMVKIIDSLIDVIIKSIPKLEELFVKLLEAVIRIITENQDEVIAAGIGLILALLRGIRQNIGQVVAMAVNIIVRFINSIASGAARIVRAGANLIIKLVTGLGQNVSRIVRAGVTAIVKFVEGLGSQAARIASAAGKAILTFLEGLRKAIDTYAPQITEASIDIGVAIISGIIQGLWNKAGDLASAITQIARDLLPGWAKKALDIFSPSGVFMDIGEAVGEGWAIGITNSAWMINRAVEDAASTSVDTMRTGLRALSDVINEEMNVNPNLNPIITPVLDLTQVRTQAEELKTLTTVAPLTAGTSYRQAAIISAQGTRAPADQANDTLAGVALNFEQNNYSPKALSEVEIYRQTRNQISQVRSALARA